MAGLLGNGFEDPQSQAIMALAGGLLQGNFGGGLLGANAAFNEAKMSAAKQRLLDAQIGNYQSEIETRKEAIRRANEDQQFGMALFGGRIPGMGSALPQSTAVGMPPGGASVGAGGTPLQQGSPEAAQSPQNWLASLNEQQVIGLMKMGKLPAGAEKLWELAKFGKERKQGDFSMMSDGSVSMTPMVKEGLGYGPGGVYVLPGAEQSQQSLTLANKLAEAAASSAGRVNLRKNADGTETPVPELSENPILQRYLGGGQRAQSTQSQGMRNSDGAPLSPDLQRLIMEDAQRNGISNPVANFKGGSAYGMAPTSQGQGYGMTNTQAAAAAAQKVYGEGQAKDILEQRKSIMSAADAAPRNIANYQQIGRLLQDVDGGKFTPAGTELASALNGFGIKVDKLLPNKQAAAALGNEIALSLRNPSGGAGMPGALSDSDRNFLASMTPNMAQSLEGRNKLIQARMAVEQRNQQIASFARNYEKKYGQLNNDFFEQLQQWSNANPLFGGK